MNLLFASWNINKLNWLRQGFHPLGLSMLPLSNTDVSEVDEDGATCEDNSLKKARAVGIRQDTIVISEDSGLFVQGLDGFPGTHTARWSTGTDDDRGKLLIQRMEGIMQRDAHFLSCVSILFPNGEEKICSGRLDGIIADRFRGNEGNGYDAIFQLPSGRTIAEIGRAAVEPIDHRRKAMTNAVSEINAWLVSV